MCCRQVFPGSSGESSVLGTGRSINRSFKAAVRLLWRLTGDSLRFLGGDEVRDGEAEGVGSSLPAGLGTHIPSLRITFLASLPID